MQAVRNHKDRFVMNIQVQKFSLIAGILAAILLAGSVLPVHGIVRRDDVADQQYIDFGNQFPTVGRLTINGNTHGSGVLIDSRWVLTAAHLSVDTNGFDFANGDGLHTVDQFIRHPDWSGTVTDGNDLALARLSEPITNVSPSDWYTGSDELGKIGVSVGFGRTGTGLTGDTQGAGTKRASNSLIEQITQSPPPQEPNPIADTLEYSFYSPDEDPDDVLALEGAAGRGDSGGPIMMDFGDGYLIVGIHSFLWTEGAENVGFYGDTVVSTRVAAYDDWIVSTIPEPGTWALWGGLVAFAAVAVWRRSVRR